jgi:hypothetical protein
MAAVRPALNSKFMRVFQTNSFFVSINRVGLRLRHGWLTVFWGGRGCGKIQSERSQ